MVKTKKAGKIGPSPRGNGSWVIQTHQGRWIDPVSPNPRSKGPNAGEHGHTVYARACDLWEYI
jgi:hypothetical protein